MWIRSWLLLTVLCSFISPSQAEEFLGLIQFKSGKTSWAHRAHGKTTDAIGFKTFLHAGDRLKIHKGAYVKIITGQRCVAVAYGPSELALPKAKEESVWSFKGEALRWVCPAGQSEQISVDGQALALNSGEVLYHDDRLVIRSSRVTASSGDLMPGSAYVWSGKTWELKTGAKEIHQNWRTGKEWPAPKEALPLGPEPENQISTRWMFGPVIGEMKMRHQNPRLSVDKSTMEGFRAMTHFRWRQHILIANLALYYSDSEDDGEDFSGANPTDFDYGRINFINAELGYRFYNMHHWSPYIRMGLGHYSYQSDTEIKIDDAAGSFFVRADEKYEYLGTSLHLGVDKVFFEKPGRFWGLHVSFEAYAFHTLAHLNTDNGEHGNLPDPLPDQLHDLEGFWYTWGVMLYLSPMLVF